MAIVRNADQGLHASDLGATVLQLRDPDATVRALEREATRLVAEAQVPVVVSARVDLALAVGSAGAHLPEADIAVTAARRLLGHARLVGRSVHSVSAALEAEAQGADYVVFGPCSAAPLTPIGRPQGWSR